MELLSSVVFLPILGLLALACVPRKAANASSERFRTAVVSLVAIDFAVALFLSAIHLIGGGSPIVNRVIPIIPEAGVSIGLYYDGASSLMLLLVSFVGLVVSRFSVRYLDGEASQGEYFRWLGFAIGAVSLMVVSGNLVLFFAAWIMTSLGLHHLLLHYQHRRAAHRAAWTKFGISRLGDAFLLSALALSYTAFGTFDLEALFAHIAQFGAGSESTAIHSAIGWLLMFGAVTKSAQFPFHIWLPDTMETPTPVSALMHAGIINAGGFLMIRMSPLMSLGPEALLALAVIGAFTACFAGVVMMTQPSVKRALAYSTIAQMGFMMLQCGLGAFTAAMLHIVAHSLYKAHAFLTTGSVLKQTPLGVGASPITRGPSVQIASLCIAAVATFAACWTALSTFGVEPQSKPGGYVLGFILCLALTAWSARLISFGRFASIALAAVGVMGLCLAYACSYAAIDVLLAPTIATITPVESTGLLIVLIAVAFCLLLVLHALLRWRVPSESLAALRVHALNGFYVEAMFHRAFAGLVRS